MLTEDATREELVAHYKELLRAIVDRNPSGLRQRIAKRLSTHRSFVSQITNPSDKTPIPVRHLNALFELCHFTPDEKNSFLQYYASAHPRNASRLTDVPKSEATQVLQIKVPTLANKKQQRAMEQFLEETAKRLAETFKL